MAFVTISIVLAISHAVVQGQIEPYEQDPCVDKAYHQFFQAVNAKFPNLAKFTGLIPAPPLLYDNLFNQSFTKDTFREYSEEYARQRSGFRNCKDSEYKRMSIYGFDFADFVFMQRADDFANRLPCIQRALSSSSQSCASCRSFLGPAGSGDSYTDMMKKCQYQNCTSICGMSSIQGACGFEAASLYRETLFQAYAVMRNYLEPPSLRPHIDSGHQSSPLPKQCKRLALMTGTDSGAVANQICTVHLVLFLIVHAVITIMVGQ